jgi:hypothetical protein
MAAGASAGQTETGQDVIFTLERGYRGPFLRRGVPMLIIAALCGYLAASSGFALFGTTALAVIFGVGGLNYLARYAWSMRFRTRLSAEGTEIRGYFNHFVRWSDVTGIESRGYELPARRSMHPPYVTASGGIDRDYATVRAGGRGQFRRGRGTGSMGGVRGKLYSVRVSRSHGRRLLLRAPLVTAWQRDPEFEAKVRLIHQWWQTYGQAAVAGSGSGSGA